MPPATKADPRAKRTPLLEVRPHNATAATGHPGRPPWQSEAAGGTANVGTKDGAPGAQRPTPSGGLKQQRQRASEVTGRKGREVGEGGSRRAAAHAKDGRATGGHSQQQRLPQAQWRSDEGAASHKNKWGGARPASQAPRRRPASQAPRTPDCLRQGGKTSEAALVLLMSLLLLLQTLQSL